MGLIGNSRELTLADLVQLKAHGHGTCRIQVQGPQGAGALLLSGSRVVHAEYAGAVGARAATALLAEEGVEYWATSDVPLPPPTMNVDARALVLDAAVQLDERRRGVPPARAPAASPRPTEAARVRGSGAARALAGAAAVAAVIGVVALARVRVGPDRASAIPAATPAPVPEPRRPEPVEASALAGPRDELPVLVAGEPPRTPVPGIALRPTVIVRILVDEAGGVTRAEVYQPRPGLEEFERTAVAAARLLRFRPALRDGAPVPAWLNWPIDFI
jgi:TonB family protein